MSPAPGVLSQIEADVSLPPFLSTNKVPASVQISENQGIHTLEHAQPHPAIYRLEESAGAEADRP